MSAPSKQSVAGKLARYGVAVVVVAIAVGLRLGMSQVVPLRSSYLLLFAAVMLAAAYGGFGPGLLATILAALASVMFTSGWPQDLREIRSVDRVQLGLFAAEGLALSLLGAMLHRARRRAEDADAEARKLEQKILEISEGERRRIGHDLHDGLGQHLTGIALLAKALKQKLSGLGLSESQQAEKIAELVNESIGWTRDLARGLSPVALDSGLAAALEDLANTASNLLGISCSSTCDRQDIPLDGETSLHLYRVAQEAINNSVKHGKARSVHIRLAAKNGQLIMTIIDDGSGLSQKTRVHPGIGLQIMQYRARMIGATLRADRAGPRGGTIVTCTVPTGSGSSKAAKDDASE